MKKKINWSKLSFCLISIIIGALLGYYSSKLFDNLQLMKGLNREVEHGLIFLLLAIPLSYFTSIIFHEGGHLIFGLLSGYKFVSFRIYNLIFIKENGKLKLKKFKVHGTAGQCLLMPPKKINNKFPYKLYNLGGIIVNSILCLMAFICLSLFNMGSFLNIFSYLIIVFNLIFILLNGIPMKLNGLPNDGYNVFLANKDTLAREGFYLTLKINGLLTEGMRYKDMPHEWFILPAEADLSNSLNASIRIQEGYWYYDKMNFKMAKECYESLLKDSVNLIDLYKKELNCMLLFLEIIGECRKERIEELYTKELKNYVKAMKSMIDKQKLLYAYELLVNDNEENAEKILEYIKKSQDTYPIKGEIFCEMDMVELIKSKHKERKLSSGLTF